jgi:hypothetical protein
VQGKYAVAIQDIKENGCNTSEKGNAQSVTVIIMEGYSKLQDIIRERKEGHTMKYTISEVSISQKG